MKFALVTTVRIDNASVVQARALLAWLAQRLPSSCLGPRDSPRSDWLGAASAGGGWQLDVISKHDDAFAARAARDCIRSTIASSSKWSEYNSAVTFAINTLYDEAEVADGLPPTKTWPHI